jgi:hypothetical protein
MVIIRINMKNLLFSFLIPITFFSFHNADAQQITGIWKGKIDKKKVEIKIIQKGDSLTGTSYYYESPSNYSRYSIKGYFEPNSNSVVWWDDQLLEERTGLLSVTQKTPLLAVADFNCPGGGEMFLEGNASDKEKQIRRGSVDLTKTSNSIFNDEWNYVTTYYTSGANHPDIIDSIGLIATSSKTNKQTSVSNDPPVVKKGGMVSIPPMREKEPVVAKVEPPVVIQQPVIEVPKTIEEKFTTRDKVFIMEIPLAGDSIELRFYDNAEVDGDSISLFLNNKLIFQNIRLTEKAYIIKLPIADMQETNDLVMVAENLGSIPPNTSYMVAIAGGKRYEAILASTENSSATIRLKKPDKTEAGN